MSAIDPLSPEIASLLARAREGAPTPSRELQDSVLRRVAATVNGGPGGDGPGESGPPPSGAAGGAATSAGSALLAPIAVGIVVAITVGGAIAVSWRSPRNHDVSTSAPLAAVSGPRQMVAVPPEAVAVPRELDLAEKATSNQAAGVGAGAVSAAAPHRRQHVHRPRRVPRPTADDALAAEAALIDGAATALRAGDVVAATTRLDVHARLYPQGQLTEERELIRVRVAFSAADLEDARRAAEAFLVRYPRSAHRAALEQTMRTR